MISKKCFINLTVKESHFMRDFSPGLKEMSHTLEYSAITHIEFSFIAKYFTKIDPSKVNFVELTGYKDETRLKFITPSGPILSNPIAIFHSLAQVFSLPMNSFSLTWIEWAFTALYEELYNPHHLSSPALDFLQSQLALQTWLDHSNLPAPGASDLVIGALIAGRMRAVTGTFAQKYFRIVRWWNGINRFFAFCPAPINLVQLAGEFSTLSITSNPGPAAHKDSKKAPASNNTIAKNLFNRAEIRVGRIINVEKHPNADRLFVEKVDIGQAEPINVVSGLVGQVTLEELQDRLALFVVNLKPAVMFKVKSQGMILVCKRVDGETTMLEPLVVPQSAKPGDRLLLEGVGEEASDNQLNPKEAPWSEIIGKMSCVDGDLIFNSTEPAKFALINGERVKSPKVVNGYVS
jgi:methionine--tRNA ligase beta chain